MIGSNDPDFEFDTFEITGDEGTVTAQKAKETEKGKGGNSTTKEGSQSDSKKFKSSRVSWWRKLITILYGPKDGNNNLANNQKNGEDGDFPSYSADYESSSTPKAKTPFTKLSSFNFKRELGRGAFGRVLLAEAKTDRKLYALKIISKKNMRSSDKRQAKAERDILHVMALKSPHPFTSTLKFAFQSENNLYLGK